MVELHRFRTSQREASKQAAVIRGMMEDLARTIQVLGADIATEEERARIVDKRDPAYPVLARTLAARRDNLKATLAALGERLGTVTATISVVVPDAA